MKKIRIISIVVCLVAIIFSVNTAHATLNLIGQGTSAWGTWNIIYDTDLDVTWYDFSFPYSPGGTWQNQLNWADALTVNFGGSIYRDWRLPTTVDGPVYSGNDGTTTAGYNITSSEMGHLFYTELRNEGYYDTSGDPTSCFSSICLINTGDFQNLVGTKYYWSGTERNPNVAPTTAWRFGFGNGFQGVATKGLSYSYAIAVRDGLAVVPQSFHRYDTDPQYWRIGDFELLNAIDDWAAVNLGDFELLDLIDFWAAVCYRWDTVNNQYESGCFVLTKSEIDVDYNGSIERATYNTYDAHGNMTKQEDDEGNNGVIDRITYYTNDVYGNHIRQERDNDNNGVIDRITYYTNDANGNRTKAEWDSNIDTVIDGATYYYNDANGNVTSSMSDNDKNGIIDSATYYTNNAKGNAIIARHDTDFDTVIDNVRYYTYDLSGNTIIKTEFDNGDNGTMNGVTYYTNDVNGNNIKREYDNNNDTLIDTVAYFTWTEL